ncbi:type II toxin-antitoxin system PemK/MazF family toxin [Bacillus paramycoides]|uniref:type II toxin-antitoxin system PemK/MazF family toxin n=1 Tax=Bacillus paramycoides TaxID=2026194 RepID=UPI0015B974A7|nr:type II toxin-antitoxin system PemK/MazF family toxin [Bacillus paramycoides]NWK72580.1 type II toxin-antitoxin system PemK/MazF family toxin [Bacillus paramycoides]
MRYSDIKEKYIYYVDFDPVKYCEFNGKHLAVVIKKNIDKNTFMVVPLTSKSNGVGVNKFNLGKIPTLPPNLSIYDSYVVYNQVRTVNTSRFIALKDNSRNKMECELDHKLFNEVVRLCSDELWSTSSVEDQLNYFSHRFTKLTVEELINNAYAIKKLFKAYKGKETKDQIIELVTKMKFLGNNSVKYDQHIPKIDLDNGILELINKCMDDTILEEIPTEVTK